MDHEGENGDMLRLQEQILDDLSEETIL